MLEGYQSSQSNLWTSNTNIDGTTNIFSVNTAGYDTVAFTLTGSSVTGSPVVWFEVFDGVNWVNLRAGRIASFQFDTTYTVVNGTQAWQCNVAGFSQFRFRLANAPTAGTIAVQCIVSTATAVSTSTVGFDPSALPLPITGTISASTSGTYNTTPPTMTNGASGPLQTDVNGNLKIAGSITATSAATYNTTPPIFTNGSANALQADVNGRLLTDAILGAGSAAIGSVSVSSLPALPAGSAAIGSVSVSSLPAVPAGSNLIGAVNVDIGGTAVSATNPVSIQYGTGVSVPPGSNLIGSVNVDIGGTTISAVNPVSIQYGTGVSVPAGTNLMGAVNVDIGGSTVSTSNPMPMIDGFQSSSSVSWTSATPINTAITFNTAGYDTVVFSVVTSNSTWSAGQINFEVYDGVQWLPIKVSRTNGFQCDQLFTFQQINSIAAYNGIYCQPWQANVAGFPQFRIRLSPALTQSGGSPTLTITGIVSSAPADSTVTVGFDSTALAAWSNFGTSPGSVPALPVNANITNGSLLIGSLGTSGSGAATILASAVAPATPAATVIKATSGRIYKIDVGNSGTTDVWLKVFNTAAASVVLGTTAVTHDLYVPKGTRQVWDLMDIGDWMSNAGFSYAVQGAIGITTTAITASTVVVNIRYA